MALYWCQLTPGVSVDFLTQISIRRNEIIVDIFSRLGKAERIGSGICRIMDFMANTGLERPTIEINAFSTITFKRASRVKVSGVGSEESSVLNSDKILVEIKASISSDYDLIKYQ